MVSEQSFVLYIFSAEHVMLTVISLKPLSLLGHKSDGFSTPKIAWSKSSMYLFGNTQDDPCICVWDIAGSTIVKKLEGEHSGQIRDIFSSNDSDTLVTVSYDKTVKFWSNEY